LGRDTTELSNEPKGINGKREKEGGIRKERRQNGRTKQLKKTITNEIKRKCKKKMEKRSK
jgi:hypothetical protein